MIAYQTNWLDALSIQAQAHKWYKRALISAVQWQEIQTRYTSGFYSPNFFVRTGLFFFCWILVSSVFGLFGVALIEAFSGSQTGTGIVLLLYSIVLTAALEYFIKEKKYFRAGIDDALLYMAVSLAITGLILCFEPILSNHIILYFIIALPFLVAGAIRYTDTLLTLVSFLCVVAILFLALESNSFTRTIIPFVCMAFSVVVYRSVRTYKTRYHLRFWINCLLVLEACSLITFYLGGNYFVVKELGENLFPGYTIPFAFLFYILTAAIPLVYLYLAIKNKDRLLLRIGLLMVALAVLTFKYYFSLGNHEVTLTIAGALMVIIAYVSIRILKRNTYGFTYLEDTTEDSPQTANAEALLIAQTFGPQATPEKEFGFGGGKFGGGGAGGNF